jgi:hypothetical protein
MVDSPNRFFYLKKVLQENCQKDGEPDIADAPSEYKELDTRPGQLQRRKLPKDENMRSNHEQNDQTERESQRHTWIFRKQKCHTQRNSENENDGQKIKASVFGKRVHQQNLLGGIK